jgi:sphingomyelin phosphodiesterase
MRNCDTPTTLVHSLLNQIGTNNKFSIFTGDLVEAAVWLVNEACANRLSVLSCS